MQQGDYCSLRDTSTGVQRSRVHRRGLRLLQPERMFLRCKLCMQYNRCVVLKSPSLPPLHVRRMQELILNGMHNCESSVINL